MADEALRDLECTCKWRLIDSGAQFSRVREREDPRCPVHAPRPPRETR